MTPQELRLLQCVHAGTYEFGLDLRPLQFAVENNWIRLYGNLPRLTSIGVSALCDACPELEGHVPAVLDPSKVDDYLLESDRAYETTDSILDGIGYTGPRHSASVQVGIYMARTLHWRKQRVTCGSTRIWAYVDPELQSLHTP